ncbi:MAG TPA: ribosomal-protein-alanine N-acetyltransferase [Anaerolineae bacterium]|nr:ribosomal-protein-alanine N-acetyltransferase [Anaerolineae bacterium]
MSETAYELPVTVQPMRLEDIEQVVEIERKSFSLPWSRGMYRYELTQNKLSHYWVLRPMVVLLSAYPECPSLLAHGGFWLFGEEAHIATLAVHPDWRRRGLGAWLLLHLLSSASTLGAKIATLEVRASNWKAQALYRKHGFRVVGERRRYYSDNNEDALIMTTPRLEGKHMRQLRAAREAAIWARLLAWSRSLRPRSLSAVG